MAEKPEDQFTSDEKIAKGKELYGRGCRNYYVKSYSEAADDLSEACKFYAEAYGVDGDELGDVYLLYAKALVAVGQEENKLIEVPENEDEDEPVEEDDGEMEQDGEAAESNDASTPLADIPEDGKYFNAHLKKLNIYVHLSRLFISGLLITFQHINHDIISLLSSAEQSSTEKTNGHANGTSEPQPGPSGTAPTAENGDSNDSEENEGEAEGDDEGGNLEVAWEVLQNAALIFQRQEDKGLAKLLDVYTEMANISIENGNFEIALDDYNRALTTYSCLDDDDRNERIAAEIHYKIGLCQSMLKLYDDSVKSFQKASEILASVIETEKSKEQTEDTAANIKDLEETLQEIQNKIIEIGDVKAEEVEKVKSELAKLYAGVNGQSADGAGTSSSGAGSSTTKSPETDKPKPMDISHLIKRKKPDTEVESSPAKKQAIETSPGEKKAIPVQAEKVVEENPSVQVAEGV
jgi:nuclear autoantigenic sperm protein